MSISAICADKKKPFRLNFIVLLSILSIFLLGYFSKDVHANTEHFLNDLKDQKVLNDRLPNKKNIIMMVTDGTGPSSINMARSYRQYIENLDYDDLLTIDNYLIGQSRTRSSSSLITDSAAGATAFSCGLKSYNGAIGVDSNKNPCGTVLEALKLKGYKTGLVVTTSLVDATPASFSSHADFRNMLDLIANQQLGLNNTLNNPVDLLIGGGRCSFLPKNDKLGSCRNDDLNLIEYAKNKGWNVSLNKKEFDNLKLGLNEEIKLPILSLLAYYNLPYEIDREDNKHPSLYEETITALNILNRETENSEEGFFLMIEGSRIDHAGHHNDAHAQVREVLAYDKAFKAVIDFAKKSDVETYIISTSDHETGGLDIGRQIGEDYPQYIWYPEYLKNAKHSGEYLNFKLNKWLKNNKNIKQEDLREFIINEILEIDLGILDYEEEELKSIIKLIFTSNKEKEDEDEDEEIIINEVEAGDKVIEYLKNMVNERALIGWSTHGHTAADVNIYGYCNKEEGYIKMLKKLGGNRENIEIGKFIETIGEIELEEVTQLLKSKNQEHKQGDLSINKLDSLHLKCLS